MTRSLTEAQGRALTELIAGSVGPSLWGRRARVFAGLKDAGMAVYSPKDGYQITDAGRAAHAALLADAEALAARYLGNANEEQERGSRAKAERWERMAQRALDRANDLREKGAS